MAPASPTRPLQTVAVPGLSRQSVVKSRLPRLRSQLYHAKLCAREQEKTSLGLSVPICKLGIMIGPLSRECLEDRMR